MKTKRSEKVSGSPSHPLPLTSHPLRRKAAAAPTPAAGVGVVEREAGALHGAHVVDGYAAQVLGAEPIDEDPDAVDLRHHIIFLRPLFYVQAVLETRSSARLDAV